MNAKYIPDFKYSFSQNMDANHLRQNLLEYLSKTGYFIVINIVNILSMFPHNCNFF